jgi:YidC/Oxa1 family membrane protein insertase
MKLKKNAILAVVVLAAVILTGSVLYANASPEQMFVEGKKLMVQAEQADRANKPAERDELYDRAVKQLRKAAGGGGPFSSQARLTPVDAAHARLMVAEAHEKSGITEKEQNKSLNRAILEYKAIEAAYDDPPDKLRSKYGSDTPAIQAVFAQASARHEELAQEIDRRNASHPLYQLIDFFVALTGRRPAVSYWLAIVIITVIVKLLITPLTKAQFKGMREMQRIQPLVKEMQAKYKGNQKELGEKIMALYKEHGINPFASCLPLLVQLPILWFLYYMIRLYEFQFARGTFLWISPELGDRFGWIASNLAQPDIPLVVMYTISMIISMRLSNVDPTQAQQQKMMSIYMPILFAFLFRTFPSAFLLYWLVFNILTTVQQYYIIHGRQEPITATAGAAGAAPAVPELPAEDAQKEEQKPTQQVRPRRRRRRR